MDINTIITSYLQEKEQEKQAKKRADAMKALIIDYAKSADNFTTDIYTVVIKTTTSTRLDTTSLYKDFPDIKNTYGKTTTSQTIDAVITADVEKASA